MSSKEMLRNTFLEAADNDDGELDGHFSDNDDLQKGSRQARYRRALQDASDNTSDGEGSDFSDGRDDEAPRDRPDLGSEESIHDTKEKPRPRDASREDAPQEMESKKLNTKTSPFLALPSITPKPFTSKSLITTEKIIHKSGVIYLSRIPPFMKPQKLRSLLSPYGTINRIYLAPEDPAKAMRRRRAGGNKKRSFVEGWVEFVDKRAAKRVVELLNARPVGGKKGSYYRDDVWAMQYLTGFKWHNLTEQIAMENAERASRMRAEIMRSVRENKEFARNVHQAKVLGGLEATRAKRKKKQKGEETESEVKADAVDDEAGIHPHKEERRRAFEQIPLAKKQKNIGDEGNDAEPERVKRILSKIF